MRCTARAELEDPTGPDFFRDRPFGVTVILFSNVETVLREENLNLSIGKILVIHWFNPVLWTAHLHLRGWSKGCNKNFRAHARNIGIDISRPKLRKSRKTKYLVIEDIVEYERVAL